MSRKRRHPVTRGRIIGIPVVIGAAAASPAFACSACVAAGLDHVIPPILYWSMVSLTWFLAMAVVSSATRHRFRGQPSLPWSIGIGTFAAFLGLIVLGPIAVLPLALPPTYAAMRTILARPHRAAPACVRKAVVLVGIAHVVAAGVGIGLLFQTLRTRTQAMYICEWSGTAPGPTEFQRLRKQEPDSVEDYRLRGD